MSPAAQAAINRMNSTSERPTRTDRARTIFLESPVPLARWNSALPRLKTMANSTTRTRILIGSMGRHSILPAPMPIRISALGRVFAPSWPMTFATVLLLALFVSLGRWQWHRGVAKQQVWAEYDRGMTQPPVDAPPRLEAAPRFAAIRMRGHFDGQHQFLLDNRFFKGNAGYEVLTPFVLEDGRRILVNRGWVPFLGYRDRLPDIALSPPSRADSLTVTGRLDEL